MQSSMVRAIVEDFGNGGTIDGDLTISGDLTVSGGGSLSFDEILEGTQVIDVTNTEAFLVRKNSDGGDVFTIDTTNSEITTGTDGAGVDVIFYSGTAGDNFTWDASEEKLTITGTNGQVALAVADGNVTITDDLDVDGTTNLDVVDIDGAVDMASTLAVAGDVTFTSATSNKPLFTIKNTNADAVPPYIAIGKDNSSAADNDEIGGIQFFGDDDANNSTAYADMFASSPDVSNGSEDGQILFRTMKAGTMTGTMTLVSGDIGINETTPHERLQVGGAIHISGARVGGAEAGLFLSSEASSTMEMVYQGADASTNGILKLISRRSNSGSAVTNMVLDSNSRISLSNNDSGTDNTVFGYDAGAAGLSGGQDNVLIGDAAGNAMTGGDFNVAIGADAMKLAVNCEQNVAIGFSALDAADGAEEQNVAIGIHAMGAVDEGASGSANLNVAIGAGAMTGGTVSTFLSNIAIGGNAMNATSTNNQTGTIAIGGDALGALTSGGGNVAVGYQSLDATGTGSDNTAVGHKTLTTLPDGGNGNTAIGYQSMEAANNSSASNNTAVGKNSLVALTTGAQNVAIGSAAGDALTTGAQNIIIGADSGSATTDVDRSVIIGYTACEANLTSAADGTVAIGYNALGVLTSGAQNVAIGYEAGQALTTGAGNVAIGWKALKTEDGDGTNVAIGGESLTTLNAGGNALNVAVGYESAKRLTTGKHNVALGGLALDSATTAGKTIAIGYEAASNLVGGTDGCIAIGYQALDGAVDGAHYTIAIGQEALGALTTGSGNVAVGYQAMAAADGDEDFNTAVGYQALAQNNHDSGDSNTVIGYKAGYDLTSGSDCVIIGTDAEASAVDAGNEIVIGSDATGVGTNSVVLGNANVTAVYMAQDSGATVYAAESYLRKDTADTTNQLLTLRNDGGGAGSGTKISMQEGGTVNGRIQTTYDSGWKMKLGSAGGLDELTLFGTNVGIGESNPADAKLQISSVQANDYGIKVTQAQNMNGIYIDNNGTASGEYIENTGSTGAGLEVYTNQGDTQNSPLIKFTSDNIAFDQQVVLLQNDANSICSEIRGTHSTMGNQLLYLNASGRSSSNGFDFLHTITGGDSDNQHLLKGDGTSYADGAWNATGADYAEYFETKDGKSIAVGTTVKLDGDKVVACGNSDTPIGVTRPYGTSTSVGNLAWNKWDKKYLKDDYGAYIMEEHTITEWVEEITVDDYVENNENYKKVEGNKEELYTENDELPKGKKVGDVKVAVVPDTYFREHSYHTDKIPSGTTAPDDATVISVEGDGRLKGQKLKRRKSNPDFDSSKDYVSREDRDEWVIVGLLGQIPVTKGQPMSDNWIKMKDVSDTVELYFVK